MRSDKHVQRIEQELKDAGVSRFGLAKMESKYLPGIIHEDEHIYGAVYGKIDFLSSMLVATEKRVLFLNREPMLSTTDEITYNVVSGVKFDKVGLFGSLTLHTRIRDYTIRYVNLKSARKFVKYIETRRIETSSQKVEDYDAESQVIAALPDGNNAYNTSVPELGPGVDREAFKFLKQNDLAVLSTVDETGTVRGAEVNYTVGKNNLIYILTRSETAKAKGIFAHGQVALTVHESGSMKTVQLEGQAELEQDPTTKKLVYQMFTTLKEYKEGKHLPPVAQLGFGSYVAIKITPTFVRYRDYSKQRG